MKNSYLFLIALIISFSGCSTKEQINPSADSYIKSAEEIAFEQKKVKNKKEEVLFNRGYNSGYEAAKKEFEKILPYVEALRASAELKGAGGLCLPPLFMDYSNKDQVKMLLGKAHVCKNFTVDDVLKLVKGGIPGLPEEYVNVNDIKQNTTTLSQVNTSFVPASVEIPEVNRTFFPNTPGAKEEVKNIPVKNTQTNRLILRNSNIAISNIIEGENQTLIAEFASAKDAEEFCNKYTICLKADK